MPAGTGDWASIDCLARAPLRTRNLYQQASNALPPARKPPHRVAGTEVPSGAIWHNEIIRLDSLLITLGDLEGWIITIDARHTLGHHTEFLHACGAHCVMTVKGNQSLLLKQLESLPLKQVTAGESAARYRARAQEHPEDQGRHAHLWHQVSQCHVGSATVSHNTAAEGNKVVDRGRLSHHHVAGPPGKSAEARHLDPRTLEN